MSSLDIFFEDIHPLKLKKSILKKHINYLIKNELKDFGEVSIVLCSDGYLLEMNKQYLNHDYYTDIITFNYVESNTISGDLFISVDRTNENAINYKSGPKKELMRVIFHGVLHLVGYNDKTDEEKKIMREKEEFYLNKVNFEEIEL